MKKLKLIFSLCMMLSVCSVQASHLGESLILTAKMSGSSEVPAVSTNALGVATFVLNAYRDTMCVSINVTGLSGAIDGIHIHDGLPGDNGPVIKDLTPYVDGNRIIVTLSGVDVSQPNLEKYLSGKFYINVHTATHPNGEIRGQITLETEYSFQAMLEGAQQVPPIATGGMGTAVFNVAKDYSAINYHVTVSALSGAMLSAHLHTGAMGVNGPVIIDLTQNIAGNTISGTLVNPPADLSDSLRMGHIYINTHTAANPAGEIRGQLMNTSERIYFDARLNGAQEVPAVAGSAIGSAAFQVNNTFDTLWVWCTATDLTSGITGAHIHSGAAGVNGGVLIDLMPFLSGDHINAIIYGAALTTPVINAMLRGETYINLHTAANPGGEIRGQIYRLAREGYTFHMDGDQQVPMVTTNATGGGVVTIDRDQTNAHVMLTSSGLNSTGIHFHEGIAGGTGPVFFDLAPYYANDGVFMYWNGANVTPFDAAVSMKFRNDSIYVNNHTAANPNGEIRGQAERGFVCFQGPNAVSDYTIVAASLSLSPNPFTSTFHIELESDRDQLASFDVVDLTGNVIYSTERTISSGYNRIEMTPYNISKGLYVLRMKTANGQIVWKIMKD